MSSPSETASAHKQDRLMTGIGQNPAGIRPMPYRKTIPGHLSQLRRSIRSLTPWAAPQRSRTWPARMMPRHPSPSPCPPRPRPPGLGQLPQRLWPGTAQAGAHAGKQSSRCSSMIRAHLLSWRPVSSATASSRSSCPSRSGSIRCCLPGKAMRREPRNCARHSGSTAHSGTASRISPVKPDHVPLAAASLSTWPA